MMYWWQLLGHIAQFEVDAWVWWNPMPMFLGHQLSYKFGDRDYSDMKWTKIKCFFCDRHHDGLPCPALKIT